jgi:hypothetical protein
MSHGYGSKEHRSWNPFAANTVKHDFRQEKVNERDPNFKGSVPKPSGMLGKKLVDANLVMNTPRPRGQESLMYGWGKGLPSWRDSEPSDIVRQVKNQRSLAEVNNLDFGNYYKATK